MKGCCIALAVALSCLSVVRAGELETFTLPAPDPGGGLWFDVQASFPDIDWQTLDRLYIPAGHWCALLLTNLPDRNPDRPLVITNIGGQVKIGGLGCGSHAILMRQGSNWKLTGKYDPVAQTGHADYRGHAGGYAHSSGTYGIWVDDAFETTIDSGLTVTAGATDFEVEFIEVMRNGFAGVLFRTDNTPDPPMANIRFHDNYIHDNMSEGIYFGSTGGQPQHQLPNLKFYNNRIVRSGTETVQIGQLGRGSEIYNNVFVFGALDWRSPWGNFQDNGGQFGVREAPVSIRDNIFIGGAGTYFQLFPQVGQDDTHFPGDTIEYRGNYFSHSRYLGAYIHPQSDQVTEMVMADNLFRELNFHYQEVNPNTTDANVIIATPNTEMAMSFLDNTWAGPQDFLSSSTPNITASGNSQVAELEPVRFMDSGFPADFDYHRLEIWGETRPDGEPLSYEVGDLVMDSGPPGTGMMYRCIQANSLKPPASHPDFWEPVPMPADDFRLHPESPHQGIGLLDTAAGLFFDGFEAGDLSAWSGSIP